MSIDRRGAWVFVFLAAFVSSCASVVRPEPKADSAQAFLDRGLAAQNVIERWPPLSALAARRLLGQYGAPDEVRSDSLVWKNNRPWKRTVAWSVAPLDAEAEGLGVLEQTVEYSLTSRQVSALRSFDLRLRYDWRSRELSSRSEREETNFLRLNLADDIVNRRMTPEQARRLYAQILRFEAAGKSSSYLQVLHSPR